MGLEAGITRSTRQALIVSLSGYGRVTYGAEFYRKAWSGTDFKFTNVSAGRFFGAGRAARLAVLHAVPGTVANNNVCNLEDARRFWVLFSALVVVLSRDIFEDGWSSGWG